MKRKISLMIAAIILSFAVTAQNGAESNGKAARKQGKPVKEMTIEEKADKEVKKRTEQLGLTAEQQVKWREITLKQLATKEEQRKINEGPTTKEQRQEMMVERKKENKELEVSRNAILTPEQLEKWKTIQAEELAKKEERKEERKEDHKQMKKG